MKFNELIQLMRDFNAKHNIERKVCVKYNESNVRVEMIGKIILKGQLFKPDYSVEKRTYTFSNYNKALTSDDLGYSIFAYCEATDDYARIEDLTNDDVIYAEIDSVIE